MSIYSTIVNTTITRTTVVYTTIIYTTIVQTIFNRSECWYTKELCSYHIEKEKAQGEGEKEKQGRYKETRKQNKITAIVIDQLIKYNSITANQYNNYDNN